MMGRMNFGTARILAAMVAAGLFVLGNARAGVVTFHSGNGSIGDQDSQVTMLVGAPTTDFAPLTAADFVAAATGPSAWVIANHPAWIGGLTEDPAARWIGTNPGANGGGSSALYAQSFVLPAGVSSATLTIILAGDDGVGGSNNEGVYINGVAVSGNSHMGGFGGESTLVRNDVASLLVGGTNTIYFDSVNGGGGPAGLIYTVSIEYSTAVPEPSTLASAALAGLLGLGAIRRRRKS